MRLLVVLLGWGALGGGSVGSAPERARPGGSEPAVEIGLLLPSDDEARALDMRRAVGLLVERVNAGGGLHGRPVRVVERTPRGGWDGGTGEIVELAFREDLLGVVGGLDGRTAHLIEQVVTKRRVVFITPWAGDPTLSRAYTPWFFRVVLDDRQQAEALWARIGPPGRVRVFVEDDYDAGKAAEAFADVARSRGAEVGPLIPLAGGPRSAPVTDAGVAAVFGHPGRVAEAFRRLRAGGFVGVLVTGREALDARFVTSGGLGVPGPVVIPDLTLAGRVRGEGPEFAATYETRFGATPSALASYTYDAATVLLDAIRVGGIDRDGVREAIAAGRTRGVTGEISFTPTGNRAVAVAEAVRHR